MSCIALFSAWEAVESKRTSACFTVADHRYSLSARELVSTRCCVYGYREIAELLFNTADEIHYRDDGSSMDESELRSGENCSSRLQDFDYACVIIRAHNASPIR